MARIERARGLVLAALLAGMAGAAATAPPGASGAGAAELSDVAVEAIAARAVPVRRSGRPCPQGCLTTAIPVEAVDPALANPDSCLINPLLERVETGTQGRAVHGALFDVAVGTGEGAGLARVLLMPRHRDGAGAAFHAGPLCLPAKLAPTLAFGAAGADKDPALDVVRGLWDRLKRIFGSDIERYTNIWVQSSPPGAEILVDNLSMGTQTDTIISVTAAHLPSLWLRWDNRRYPIAACRVRPSLRQRVAREYHCRVN